MEKLEASYIASGAANGVASFVNQFAFLKKLNIELPYEPTSPLLGIFQEKRKHTPTQKTYI